MTARRTAAKKPTPAALAKALVNARLAVVTDDWLDFVEPQGAGSDQEYLEWEALVKAVRHQQSPKVTEAMLDALAEAGDEDVINAVRESYAGAAFPIGMELGRRLAGAGR
jgi:hypothetical protein